MLERELNRGFNNVIAAGGDGTVNAVLNALIDPRSDKIPNDVTFGAIGIGSSNDFHKPISESRTLADSPICIDRSQASPVDVGKATYVDEQGRSQQRYFLLNASLGFVAEGNSFFNTDDRALGFFKRRNVEVAILYTALVNLVKFRSLRLRIRLDNAADAITLDTTSLGILKRVHFAGGMYYDTDVTADDGQLDIVSWGDLGRAGIVWTMKRLYGGKFRDNRSAKYWRARKIHIAPDQPSHLELDGEIVTIHEAEIQVVPRLLNLCG